MNATITATVTTKCGRCGRSLRSAKSVAEGYGPTCKAKMVKAAKELVGFKAFQIDKAREVIELRAIMRLVDGGYEVVASNGLDVYATSVDACSCPAGEHGRACYHRAAAAILAA